jgi:hypothetical protein
MQSLAHLGIGQALLVRWRERRPRAHEYKTVTTLCAKRRHPRIVTRCGDFSLCGERRQVLLNSDLSVLGAWQRISHIS